MMMMMMMMMMMAMLVRVVSEVIWYRTDTLTKPRALNDLVPAGARGVQGECAA
jgi:hypothetical protein